MAAPTGLRTDISSQTTMAESEQPSIRCPYCGSLRVRRSSRQSSTRPVEIYRCSSCKRHFEQSAASANVPSRFIKYFESLNLGLAVIVVLAVITIVTAIIVSLGDWEQGTGDGVQIPGGGADSPSSAPAVGSDSVSQFQRGLYFWNMAEYRQAFPWFKSAAEMGHREAHYYLGLAYLYGRGTVQNYRLAFEQIQAAAHKNDLNSQHQLGLMYRDGVGTPVNREQAYIWLNIAASRGQEIASHDRDKLSLLMSEDEITRAQESTMNQLAKLDAAATPPALAGTAAMTKNIP
jgi:DNA-directed RNA polymerase subunit RPC12/RpoP